MINVDSFIQVGNHYRHVHTGAIIKVVDLYKELINGREVLCAKYEKCTQNKLVRALYAKPLYVLEQTYKLTVWNP